MGKIGIALILAGAGLAAFGYYRYSKLTEEEKRNLKDKGKRFFDENFSGMGKMFGKQKTENSYSQA